MVVHLMDRRVSEFSASERALFFLLYDVSLRIYFGGQMEREG